MACKVCHDNAVEYLIKYVNYNFQKFDKDTTELAVCKYCLAEIESNLQDRGTKYKIYKYGRKTELTAKQIKKIIKDLSVEIFKDIKIPKPLNTTRDIKVVGKKKSVDGDK